MLKSQNKAATIPGDSGVAVRRRGTERCVATVLTVPGPSWEERRHKRAPSRVHANVSRFPHAPRVIYRQNTLVEVLCQLRFPRILRIDAELPATFQERLRSRYPVLKESAAIEVSSLPPELARIPGLEQAIQAGQRKYDLVSKDDLWKVTLTSGFVALTTSRYERWEDFRERIDEVLRVLADVYVPSEFVRIGLRYQNVIRRSALQLEGTSWRGLLAEHTLGELREDWLEPSIEHAAREIVVRMEVPGDRVRIQHGFVQAADATQEQCYLIDADFFRDESTEVGDAISVLTRLNGESGRLFRWLIEGRLHEAMGPDEVG